MQSSKQKNHQKAIRSNKMIPSILCKHLKGVCPDKQPKTLSSLNIDGEVIPKKQSESVNALNPFYADGPSKYTPVRSTDLHDDISEKTLVNEKVNKNTLFTLQELSTDFVLKQLGSMSNSKSTGFVGIGVSRPTLKLAAPAVADSITSLCNLNSVTTKSCQDKSKEAKVTPIFKKEKI